jgi:molybdopterin-guanine dinucleotide biosynthesis protein A
MTVRRTGRVAGIVLAGGRATRFGRDKRFVLVDGEPLVHRSLRAVAAAVDRLVLVIGPNEPSPTLPADLGRVVTITRDRLAYAGPLAGLLTGLEAAPDSELAVVVGADMPSLEPAVLRLLLRAAEGGPDAWTLEGPDPAIVGPLPLAGRTTALMAAARALLERGERSLRGLVLVTRAGRVLAAEWRALDPAGATLRDIDRPEDLPG